MAITSALEKCLRNKDESL